MKQYFDEIAQAEQEAIRRKSQVTAQWIDLKSSVRRKATSPGGVATVLGGVLLAVYFLLFRRKIGHRASAAGPLWTTLIPTLASIYAAMRSKTDTRLGKR